MPNAGRSENCRLEHETVYALLRSERRRKVVTAVVAADGPVAADALATMVAAAERRVPPDRLDAAYHRSVCAALLDEHLPRLAAACAVREREAGYVPGENADALVSVIDATAAVL